MGSASAITTSSPIITARALNRPACTTRVGPTRSCVSSPFWKSSTSLARFEAICRSSAPASAASAGHSLNPRTEYATALPTSTGATAAGSVFGRTAVIQARAPLITDTA